ncbi:MAG TPA: FKBP-type peptidyl-prolyl cis-trans isomerase, partial [Draconibacterium sp.]|nr:FKBP-type peptidyl-prolyl cis-trans isomerase [Draconibacterium sp.]
APLFIISCGDNFETPSRTPETEQSELKQAIANIEAGGYDVDTTDLGVFYVMHEEGTGPLTQQGDTCYLIYTGYFLNGLIFDSSGYYYPDSVWQFNYLDVALIPGFNDGIALLKKGAKADIIVPSNLAYGPTGQGEIQPYTPLVFSLIMRDLKPVE